MRIMVVSRKTAIKNAFILQAWPMKFWAMRRSVRSTTAIGASRIMRISINRKNNRRRMKSMGVGITAKNGSG
jgi:hypothetical protein